MSFVLNCVNIALLFLSVSSRDGIFFQGVAMPAMNNILSKWVPVSERSRSLALVYSGMYLGSVTGLAFSPLLIHKFGWPSVFYSFGSLGTVWFAIWLSKVTCLCILLSPWSFSCSLCFIAWLFLCVCFVCHKHLKLVIGMESFENVLVIFLKWLSIMKMHL